MCRCSFEGCRWRSACRWSNCKLCHLPVAVYCILPLFTCADIGCCSSRSTKALPARSHRRSRSIDDFRREPFMASSAAENVPSSARLRMGAARGLDLRTNAQQNRTHAMPAATSAAGSRETLKLTSPELRQLLKSYALAPRPFLRSPLGSGTFHHKVTRRQLLPIPQPSPACPSVA